MPPKRPAARIRTIDPARVTTLEEWLQFYKQKYGNLILETDGRFAVYDPEDITKHVKDIPLRKGVDVQSVLASGDTSELRGHAVAKYNAIMEAKRVAKEGLTEAYVAKEAELLRLTHEWTRSPDSATKVPFLDPITAVSEELRALDTQLRDVMYPRRAIVSDGLVTRQQLDYRTQDPRKLDVTLYALRPEYTIATQRILPM